MSSLSEVVSAMSKEVNNSTLGWDVVVNYSATDLNRVLKTAYDKGDEGQLKELRISLNIEEEISGLKYVVDYIFELGSPLVQFEALPMMTSGCQLDIAIIGGSVKIDEYGKYYTIPKDRYRLFLSGIALASINGTKGAARDPKPSDQPFVFDSPDTIGGVSLDIETSAKENRLQVELSIHGSGDEIPLIDGHLGDLNNKILTEFQQPDAPPIHWDLAQVNNARPSSGSSQLVPKDFRFACYSPSATSYTILSIFIHLEGGDQSGTTSELQEKWSVQWAKPDDQSPKSYGVPPIPDLYTASLIFNHGWIEKIVEKAVKEAGMTLEVITKAGDDTWSLKWKILTGKKYVVKRLSATSSEWPYSNFSVDGVTINLDTLPEADALYMSIGQNGQTQANALLNWQINYDSEWMWVNGANGNELSGPVSVTNKLDYKMSFDDDALPDYRVHLNVQIDKDNWDRRTSAGGKWEEIYNYLGYNQVVLDALPAPPNIDLELFDIDFFMTTNLLLPNSDVINFKAEPGVRFPRDLYLVGNIINLNQVKRRPRHGH